MIGNFSQRKFWKNCGRILIQRSPFFVVPFSAHLGHLAPGNALGLVPQLVVAANMTRLSLSLAGGSFLLVGLISLISIPVLRPQVSITQSLVGWWISSYRFHHILAITSHVGIGRQDKHSIRMLWLVASFGSTWRPFGQPQAVLLFCVSSASKILCHHLCFNMRRNETPDRCQHVHFHLFLGSMRREGHQTTCLCIALHVSFLWWRRQYIVAWPSGIFKEGLARNTECSTCFPITFLVLFF